MRLNFGGIVKNWLHGLDVKGRGEEKVEGALKSHDVQGCLKGTNRDVIRICHISLPEALFNTFESHTRFFPLERFRRVTHHGFLLELQMCIGKMKGFNFAMASAFARSVPRPTVTRGVWTCRQCLQQSRGSRIGDQIREYARNSKSKTYGTGSQSAKSKPKSKKKGRVLFAAAGGALGVTAVALTDDVRHAYGAAERTGRVVSTLAVCINE